VVALEPDLEEVVEAAVLGDVSWRKVAVVVEDRLMRRIFVEERAGRCSSGSMGRK